MNIFFRELKANFRSLLIWGGVVILFIMVGVSKFSAYYNNPDLLDTLNSLPQQVLAILNLQAFNLTTISGFYGIMFIYFALLLSIAAAMWGADIIAKEQRDKTVEFSLTLPVTRKKVVTSKTLAALVNCVLLLLITWGTSIAASGNYQPDSTFFRFLALSMLALFLLQLIFLSIGVFIGTALKRYKMASSTALFVLLGTYFLSVVITLNSSLDFLKYLTPFKYFDPADLLHQSKFEPVFIGLSLLIVVISFIGARIAYNRRDLYI
ncbi:MAG: ABC transporter permease subunit [Dehalogenimonas sp.]